MVSPAWRRSVTCMPLSRASTFGLSPKREPILVNVLPSQAMKSNSPPTIRWAMGGSGAPGCAVTASAGAAGGFASDEGVVAVAVVGLEAGQGNVNALDPVAVIATERNAGTIARLSFRIDVVTLQL